MCILTATTTRPAVQLSLLQLLAFLLFAFCNHWCSFIQYLFTRSSALQDNTTRKDNRNAEDEEALAVDGGVEFA